MAPRKVKPEATPARIRTAATTVKPRVPRQTVQTAIADPNRLLREAAWSRMFGRTETKNPFAR
jgi:hypothetical protein